MARSVLSELEHYLSGFDRCIVEARAPMHHHSPMLTSIVPGLGRERVGQQRVGQHCCLGKLLEFHLQLIDIRGGLECRSHMDVLVFDKLDE